MGGALKKFIESSATLLAFRRNAIASTKPRSWLAVGNSVPLDTPHLVSQIDILVEAYCPCGAERPHLLPITGIGECARCGGRFAVTAVTYTRPRAGLPAPSITIDWVD